MVVIMVVMKKPGGMISCLAKGRSRTDAGVEQNAGRRIVSFYGPVESELSIDAFD